MADNVLPRQAILVAISETLSADEMSVVAKAQADRSRSKGEIRPGAVVPIPVGESTWEIHEGADRSASIEEVIDRLFLRAIAMRSSFIGLMRADCKIKLEIVQWIAADDSHGPGFSLSLEVIDFLAEIGATVDVDQYLD